MKQHITVEDLLSLTPAQQERLREWYLDRRQFGDWVAFQKDGAWRADILVEYNEAYCWASGWYADHTQVPADKILPLLSIGQCMELLAEQGVGLDNFCVGFDETTQEYKGRGWICLLTKPQRNFRANEPLDALFAAVKEVV